MRWATPLLGLVLAASPAAAEGLDGAWFGERWSGGTLIQHLSHRTPEGRFTVRFRFLEGCIEVGGQSQTGRWELVGAEFRTWIETVNGRLPRGDGSPVAITYAVEALDGDTVAYRAPNGVLHHARRVPEDYAMPMPPRCGVTS